MGPESADELISGRFNQALSRTFSSLRIRNFRLFFIGQTISNTGNWLTNVALVLLVLKLTHSGLDVGLMTACQFGPILFLSPWGGAVADRVDKRHFLFFTQGAEMAQSIGLAILAFLPHTPLFGLYILAALGGIFLALDNPLRRSFVSEMVPPRQVPNAVVLYSTIVNTSRIFGPALAGALIISVGYGWCFSLDAATYMAVLFCLQRMRPAELLRPAPQVRAGDEVRAGLRYIRSSPRLFVSFIMLAAIGTLAYNFNVTLPLLVTKSLHHSGSAFTLLYAVFSCGAVLSALLVAHRNLVQMKHIILGAAALGAAMLLLAAVPSLGLAFPVIFLVGMASILYTTSTTAMVQVMAKPQMRGRVLALQTVFLAGTTPVGGPLLGWLADILGGRAPILIGGVVCLATAAFGYLIGNYAEN